MTPNLVLWSYTVLLTLGGLMGFLKAKSKASLMMSLAFALPLALIAAGVINVPHLADILILVLLLFFTIRYIKGRKFMPAGLMMIASIIALLLRWVITVTIQAP